MIKININDINYDIISHKKEKEENDIEGDKISLIYDALILSFVR